MSLSIEQIKRIANETLGQYKNPTWFNSRLGKLLTSNFHDAVKMCDKIDKLPTMNYADAWRLLHDDIPLRRSWLTHTDVKGIYPWIKWCLDHEKDGLRVYEHESGCFVRRSGLWMFPSGNIGGSPDGLAFESRHSVDPEGIVEVNCPWKLRNYKTITDEEM